MTNRQTPKSSWSTLRGPFSHNFAVIVTSSRKGLEVESNIRYGLNLALPIHYTIPALLCNKELSTSAQSHRTSICIEATAIISRDAVLLTLFVSFLNTCCLIPPFSGHKTKTTASHLLRQTSNHCKSGPVFFGLEIRPGVGEQPRHCDVRYDLPPQNQQRLFFCACRFVALEANPTGEIARHYIFTSHFRL